MGREVKRVPLDFQHPLNEVWPGFLMPDELDLPTCPDCGGRGATAAHEWVSAVVRVLLLLDVDLIAQAQGRPMHPYLESLATRPGGLRPSADIAEFGRGLAGREPFIIHDAIDQWTATDALIKAAGLPDTWGRCSTCSGNGEVGTDEQRAAQEAWVSTGPPEGEGWQLWETVSEGSPISPVFGSAEDLARWMTQNRCTVSGPMSSYEAALRFVRAGWAPSLVMSPETGVTSGTEWIGAES